jgi:hypothetical protein
MPQYHFDLVDSQNIADEGGAELENDADALVAAKEIAQRVLQDFPELKHRNYKVAVSDAEGEELFRIPLDLIH